MNKEQLFSKTIQDLENRIKSNDEYEILMISLLLRKLLLDDNSLIYTTNREKRKKIVFVINDRNPPPNDPDLVFWSTEDGLDPETAAFKKPKKVNLDQLLATVVLKIGTNAYTIKDAIKHLAHCEGAVHYQTPKEEKDKILKRLVQELNIGGLPALSRLLKAIARVVLKGLKELIT